jgi:hypothetical protein
MNGFILISGNTGKVSPCTCRPVVSDQDILLSEFGLSREQQTEERAPYILPAYTFRADGGSECDEEGPDRGVHQWHLRHANFWKTSTRSVETKEQGYLCSEPSFLERNRIRESMLMLKKGICDGKWRLYIDYGRIIG